MYNMISFIFVKIALAAKGKKETNLRTFQASLKRDSGGFLGSS